jgi:hypothetical protein
MKNCNGKGLTQTRPSSKESSQTLMSIESAYVSGPKKCQYSGYSDTLE